MAEKGLSSAAHAPASAGVTAATGSGLLRLEAAEEIHEGFPAASRLRRVGAEDQRLQTSCHRVRGDRRGPLQDARARVLHHAPGQEGGVGRSGLVGVRTEFPRGTIRLMCRWCAVSLVGVAGRERVWLFLRAWPHVERARAARTVEHLADGVVGVAEDDDAVGRRSCRFESGMRSERWKF